MQPPDGDQISEPPPPQPPPVGPSPEADTTRLPWAPAEPAPAPAPVAPTGWTAPGEPKPSGWTEAQAPPLAACLVIILVGIVAFVGLILVLIYFGSQVSTILSTVGDSV